MKIAIAASLASPLCLELKNKIIDYIKKQNITNLEVIDAGPDVFIESKEPLEYLENLAKMLQQNKVNKIISICIRGVSAAKASINMGIPANIIAQQNVIEVENLEDFTVLTLGTAYEWENTKTYVDYFIK